MTCACSIVACALNGMVTNVLWGEDTVALNAIAFASGVCGSRVPLRMRTSLLVTMGFPASGSSGKEGHRGCTWPRRSEPSLQMERALQRAVNVAIVGAGRSQRSEKTTFQ